VCGRYGVKVVSGPAARQLCKQAAGDVTPQGILGKSGLDAL